MISMVSDIHERYSYQFAVLLLHVMLDILDCFMSRIAMKLLDQALNYVTEMF